MTQFRKSDIANRLNDWLFSGRYNPPRDFKGNDRAEKAEAEALLSVLLKMAPHSDYQSFLDAFFDRLEDTLKVRSWPNKHEVTQICSGLRKERPVLVPESDQIDMSPEAIIGRKMARGEPVGEGWLWGLSAVELIVGRHVTKEVMDAYRLGAFNARADASTYDKAVEWENEAKQRHEDGKELYRARNDRKEQRRIELGSKRGNLLEAYE